MRHALATHQTSNRPQQVSFAKINSLIDMKNKNLSYRSAGWAAVSSGIIGIIAFGFLITAVQHENQWK